MKAEFNILEEINDSVISLGKNGIISYVNKAFADVAGFEPSKMMGKNLWELLPKLAQSIVYKNVNEAIEKNQPMTFEWQGPYTNRIWETKVFPFAEGVTAIGREITERKKAEEALRASEARLRSIFENSLDAVLLTAPDGRIFRANPTAERMLGMTEKEIIEAGRQGLVVPDERLTKALKERSETEKTTAELTMRRKDGSIFPVELTSSLFADFDGSTKTSIIIRDITERKKAEQAVTRQANLIDLSPDAILVREIDGTITFWSRGAEKLYGYTKEEALGQKSHYLLKTAFPVPFEEIIAQLKETGKWQGELTHKTKINRTVIVQSNWQVEKSSKQQLSILESNIDITERKKAEEALRSSEERFRSVINNSPDIVYRLNLHTTKYEYLSPAVKSMVGFEPEELQAMSPEEIQSRMHPDDIDGLRHFLDKVIKVGKGTFDYRFLTKDGKYRWISNQAVIVNDSNGKPLYRDGFLRDITERKKEEQALKESEERFSKVFKISPAAISISRLSDGLLIDVNEAYLKLFGFNRSEVIGHSSIELEIVSSSMERKKLLSDVIREGGINNREVQFKNKKGEIVQTLTSVSRFTLRKEVVLISIIIDITQRKNVEEELRKSERLYKSMFENTEEGFQLVEILFDEAGNAYDFRFLRVNKEYERQTGLKASEIVGKTVKEYLPGIEPFWISTYGNVAKSGKAVSFQQYNKNTNRWYEVYAFLYAENQVAALFSDITEHKKLEKQLQDSERMATIGQTAGMVGHDIRNPLQSITGELYLLNGSLADLPDSNQKNEMKESLDSITENIFYINKIIADLQDYTRHISAEYSTVDLSSILVKIFENVRVPESIKLSIKVNDLEKLRTDPTLLQRALSNLVTNAVQAMPEGGILEVTGHPQENKAVITVSDTGVGIPDDIKPKLFTPMMTTKAKGQGFGLAVSKRLIEAMKGTISFESEKGKGTKFIIELPIHSIIRSY